MRTATLLAVLVDLAAISVLVLVLYFPRHHKRDLVGAFIGMNLGVFAVAQVLTATTVGFGIGLGLFGVLSIIRLRSDPIDQTEVAYYFSALVIGLLTGVTSDSTWRMMLLVTLVVLAMFVGDHPALLREHRAQIVVIDRAIADEAELIAHLERVLKVEVTQATTLKLDFVSDSTQVDVRYRARPRPATAG